MANHKSALKAYKQSETKRLRNRTVRSELRKALKDVRVQTEAANLEESKKAFLTAQKLLDKSVTKGVVKANTSSRLKSRLNNLVKKVAKAA